VRVALDTNILVYAEGLNGAARRDQALAAIEAIGDDELVLPVQTLGELFVVLTRKAGRTAADARLAIRRWEEAALVVPTDAGVLADAAELVVAHRFSFWDAVIVAAAATAGARTLLTEDMNHGFVWRSLAIRNPFAYPSPP
jgi:predicted nucleic acid-binding protein